MKKLFLFIFFFIPFNACAMDATQSATADVLLKGQVTALVNKIKEAQRGEEVLVSAPFSLDPRMKKALNEAAQRGADVTVFSKGVKGISSLDTFKHIFIPDLHTKAVVIGNRFAATGSSNMSTLANFHDELVVINTDPAIVSQIRTELSSYKTFPVSPLSTKRKLLEELTPNRPIKKQILKITPDKPTVISSKEYELDASKAARLRKVFDNPEQFQTVDISSMTFDSDAMVKAIEQGYLRSSSNRPHIRLFLDRSALRHPDLLERMKAAGGKDLEIFIGNPEGSEKIFGRFPRIAHRKFLLREGKPQSDSEPAPAFVDISTANLTSTSNRQKNIDLMYPSHPALLRQTKQAADEMAQQYKPYILPQTPTKRSSIEDLD